MSDGPHISWCVGRHDQYTGECEMGREWVDCTGDRREVVLTAVPCDNAYIFIGDNYLYDETDIDALMAVLAELRPVLAATRVEIDCDLHEHPEDNDLGEDDDPDDEVG